MNESGYDTENDTQTLLSNFVFYHLLGWLLLLFSLYIFKKETWAINKYK